MFGHLDMTLSSKLTIERFSVGQIMNKISQRSRTEKMAPKDSVCFTQDYALRPVDAKQIF